MQGNEAVMTEHESMGDDTTSDRLALAVSDFEFGDRHLADLDKKAQTLLAIDSLMTTGGILSISSVPHGLETCSPLFYGLVVAAIGSGCCLFAAFQALFSVFEVRRYSGHPDAKYTLETMKSQDGPTLRESLAMAYADAAASNREAVSSVAQVVKAAMGWSRWAFLWFVPLAAILVAISLLGAGK